MSEVSVDQLKLVAKRANLTIHFELLEYWVGDPSPEALVSLIDRAIDECSTAMGQYPKEFDPQKEDQLTITLILQLSKYGFDVAHDATSGGHCDIVIKDAGGFLWLGEVKKVSGINNSHLGGGFDQLMLRYATGLPAQDQGSLVIFCNCPRIDEILKSWLDFLLKEYNDTSIVQYDDKNIFFKSNHKSEKTGRPYIVRHKPISVYFPPSHKVTSLRKRAARS
ncbi:hypothetical protein [Mesorhizobium sp.]|uniref:hypothetical protein n=1 Tax=Mesorhizobium sp. TaxID=1871066 RepID=UPI000FE5A1F3|nr:hypothetical protein [Mesorhizobium sp.]RWN54139.1 MAG: hypothetical protein EOS00_29070 [Mesorhizobium sp.]